MRLSSEPKKILRRTYSLKYSDVEYNCHLCDYMAELKFQLRSHNETSHERIKTCDMCNYQAQQKRSLEGHLHLKYSDFHTEVERKLTKYKCKKLHSKGKKNNF